MFLYVRIYIYIIYIFIYYNKFIYVYGNKIMEQPLVSWFSPHGIRTANCSWTYLTSTSCPFSSHPGSPLSWGCQRFKVAPGVHRHQRRLAVFEKRCSALITSLLILCQNKNISPWVQFNLYACMYACDASYWSLISIGKLRPTIWLLDSHQRGYATVATVRTAVVETWKTALNGTSLYTYMFKIFLHCWRSGATQLNKLRGDWGAQGLRPTKTNSRHWDRSLEITSHRRSCGTSAT